MKIILFLVRRVLSVRYRVKLEGIDNLKHDGPVLLLPNHVALVDPRIILSFLGKYLQISPLASEKYYNKPVFKQIMRFFGAVPIGEISDGADRNKVKEVFKKVVNALDDGRNILIYPSGQIYRQGFESIKGKQSVYNIVQMMPDNTKILGIRDRGLWGSIWSMAWDNGKTGFFALYGKSILYVLLNLIFFVPKREVNIEIEDITDDIYILKNKSLNEFNIFLENFYNKSDKKDKDKYKYIESIKYIKHYFYYNDVKNRKIPAIITGSEKDLNSVKEYDLSKIDNDTKKNILKKISDIKGLKISDIKDNSNLVLDLFFDSLDAAEIKSFVLGNFQGASNPPITDLKTPGDLYIMAIGQSENNEKLKDCDWLKEEKNIINLVDKIGNITNKNILDIWKQSFKISKNDNFMWDNIFGMQSKKDFIIKAYLISDYIKKIEGDYIGVMLPAVGSSPLLIIATYLAQKTPVMFNWTLGKDSFNHCAEFSKVDKILTSNNFYDRIKNDFLDEHKDAGEFIFLEDLLKGVGIFDKIKALIKSFYMPLPKISDTGVILFTSGSESLPKAVPLSHENLLENIVGAISIFNLKSDDKLIGFLPPFHSFGFTINTIMPLITAMKVSYTPDPNDAKTILNIIKHTQITTITATPTFLKMIMNLASENDLKNIRYSVVGAEKCSLEVFEKFKILSPNGIILEGYGITECSPVVSINPIKGAKPGSVGKIIDCLDIKIIDIDTNKEVKTGEQGMIYVGGKSIFSGYLDNKIESPFEKIDGKLYYKTGDLGFLDSTGFLSITGRLKRFIKIAGEMISLPFIEGVLMKKYGNTDELSIAIEAIEKDGNVKIVLFSIEDLKVEKVNDYMRKNGVPNLVKISEVIILKEIPILGTGKTDYKVLKGMIN